MKSLVITSDCQTEQWLNTFTDLYRKNILTDVTLVCDDKVKLYAHKIVLCAGSSLFRDFLVNNSHSHPLLFLKGVKQHQLIPLLQFLYYGEVKIAQDKLNDLLRTAQELEVLGLSDDTSIGHDIEKDEISKKPIEEIVTSKNNFQNMDTVMMESDSSNQTFSHDQHDINRISQNSLTRQLALLHQNNAPSSEIRKSYFEGSESNEKISREIETTHENHVESHGESFPSNKEIYNCLMCDFKGISHKSLERHKSMMHKNQEEQQFSLMKEQLKSEIIEGTNYVCDHCEFKGINIEALNRHNQMMHKDQVNTDPLKQSTDENKETDFDEIKRMQLECSSCNFRLQSATEARRHMKSYHNDPTIKVKCLVCALSYTLNSIKKHYYSVHSNQRLKCDLRNFETNRLDSLKGHKLVIHESKYKYECQLCNFRAMKPGALSTHHSYKHSS